jgi:septation ring formation regulator EzrA
MNWSQSMSEVENLLLEHLKRFQAGQDRIERKLEEITRRISNLEAGQASIIQHIGHLASADAQQQLAADGFNSRLERIERRLELA